MATELEKLISEPDKLIEDAKELTKSRELDLSADGDLSMAIMNLLAIEEHLYFTGAMTSKKIYFKLLKEIREMRVDLLKKIVHDYEGEIWCTSKHSLNASMRLMEVGTKLMARGREEEAISFFNRAYQLYSLFWTINLKIVDKRSAEEPEEIPSPTTEPDLEAMTSKAFASQASAGSEDQSHLPKTCKE